MAFTTPKASQKAFLETYLRGTGRTLTDADAKARFGIRNLSARVSEMRDAGLDIRTELATTGKARYRMVARDVTGSRARVFVD